MEVLVMPALGLCVAEFEVGEARDEGHLEELE
jgi:hypothetical protein